MVGSLDQSCRGDTVSKVQSTRGFKWMLLVMGVFVLPGLLGLGIWQLGRAEEKQVLIQQWQGSGEVAKGLNHPSLQQFSLIRHQGKFEQERWFLLDNRTRQGRVGYEIVALFFPQRSERHILVNLGWVSADQDRRILPKIELPKGVVTVQGRLTEVSKPLVLGESLWRPTWPQRIQRIELDGLEQRLGIILMPWVIRPNEPVLPEADLSWSPAVMLPEKHQAYAVQWFAMAGVLVLLIGWNLLRLRREEAGI